MASPYLWLLCVFLPGVIAQDKQHVSTGNPLPVPEIVNVYNDIGDPFKTIWKMNVKWKNNFINSSLNEQVTYDIQIFYTEQMRLVHNETIQVKPDLNGTHSWSWTSPIPLQCTSHSVRLRVRDRNLTSDWTPLKTLQGNDITKISESVVYPKNHISRVGDGIIFCCILKDESVSGFKSSDFKIRISNRTYITDPVRRNTTSETAGYDITCDNRGATYYVGYPPDDRNLTCETRDLSSVKCHLSPGETGKSYMFIVYYQVNGRKCILEDCFLNDNIDQGVMNWTLTASNALGTKIISDQGDPKHRVRLIAPINVHVTLVHARNVTLEWNWEGTLGNKLFPMTCEVELNGRNREERFNGTTLKSLVLADLQPYTDYTARVRCGALNHFYKWGDWSEGIIFSTNEDIPEALDVWMEVVNKTNYVVWKEQSANQSHGCITSYELLVGSSKEMNKKNFSKSSLQHCHKLSPSAESNYYISVSAKNSVGVSPPSNITIPTLLSDRGIVDGTIAGHNGGFNISWKTSPISSCGYVVDWFPTYRREPCAVKWTKFSHQVSNAKIYSEFKPGVKYTLSVYACTSAAPQLLQRKEGYVKELAPSGKVYNLTIEQHGVKIKLSWKDMPEKEKNGFILGYNVSYEQPNGEKSYKIVRIDNKMIKTDPSSREFILSNILGGTYTFNVKAFTSAGEGPGNEIKQLVDLQVDPIFFSILASLVTAVVIFTIIAFCFSKRRWLKKKVYPDIPKPVLSEMFTKEPHQCPLIDKMLHAESKALMVEYLEPCPEVVPQFQKENKEVDHIIKDSMWQEYINDACDSLPVSPITVDLSYIGAPTPGILNPSYNMTLSLPDCDHLILGYIPQVQSPSL
ncbi:LIF receptor subunit alpha b [Hoplias malabaricus]|uniref:LIF receptor subunit alpha b n=1 Tax=Hoplias malabaricus TaxID=27720 RepID=UPI00346333F9